MTLKLPRDFYNRPTLDVARDLIGKVMVHRRRDVVTSGVIVEIEAYIGESDPACHAAPGRTERNAPMYGAPGHAYVYLNYGIHCLVNIVTEAEDSPAAVLIRALEPLDGISTMRRRRARTMKGRRTLDRRTHGGQYPVSLPTHELCRGPGNLTMAMGITLAENALDLTGDRLFIEDRGVALEKTLRHEGHKGHRGTEFDSIAWGPRIGIRVGTEQPWRAWVADHPAVSANTRKR